MALVIPSIKQIVIAKTLAAYQREFASLQKDNPEAAANWQKQANIAGDIAEAIFQVLMTQATVAPGIPVATPTGPGSTIGPGMII